MNLFLDYEQKTRDNGAAISKNKSFYKRKQIDLRDISSNSIT